MDEKVIVKTEKIRLKDLGLILLKVFPFALIIGTIFTFLMSYIAKGKINFGIIDEYIGVSLLWGLAITTIVGAILWPVFQNQLIVTDKRVSGRTSTGKRVDLPVDSISAVGTTNKFKGLTISTSSGVLSFFGLSNRDEIYKVISQLIISRQPKTASAEQKTSVGSDYTEELKKIKELLDAGIITQEEFDAKKKQILGL